MADSSGQWSSSSGNTLPEHHPALALLQQLDHAWFHDNLLQPRLTAFRLSSPSPFQSIELIHGKCASSYRPSHGHMPCSTFRKPLPHQQPALVPAPHTSLNPLVDTILSPPASNTQSVNNFLRLKDFPVNRTYRALKLDSTESEKQLRVSLVDAQLPQPAVGTRRAHKKSSKSMTALEFSELQGFMDLGFQFSQDDLTPRIVTMFPALKHRLGEDEFGRSPRALISKSKQSSLDSWLLRGSAVSSHHWHIPVTNEDMKEHLKFWARAVALTVRQEC